MPTRTVTQSTANAGKGSLAYRLAKALNDFIQYRPLGVASFEISTNFDIQNGVAFDYVNGGTVKTLTTDQVFDTGTSKNIAIDQWGAARLSITAAGAGAVTWADDDYATEALAIAALQDTEIAATETPVGYVTVKTKAEADWTAGTDALQGGTGGDVSSDTNYYNLPLHDIISFRELGGLPS
jgi:hypothetical protein